MTGCWRQLPELGCRRLGESRGEERHWNQKSAQTVDDLVEELRRAAALYGRTPKATEQSNLRMRLSHRGIGWRKACEMAGLQPVPRNWRPKILPRDIHG